MQTKEKLIEQVQRLLEERSQKALKIAKKEVLKEKMECKEIIDALKYYVGNWNDVIHPGLISIACEAVRGNINKSIPIQVVMLLYSAAADIHDDIIDGSKTKYGKPTVFARFGRDISLLVGDSFLLKALVFLHKSEKKFPIEKMDAIWNLINNAFFEMEDAEALEATLKGNIDISPEEYLRILKMKASTFEAHMRIGAIVGGGEQDVVDLLGSCGRLLGTLLFIREDFIDTFEPAELQNRFSNECLPLPILYAFRNPQTKKTILDYLSKREISEEDAGRMVDIIFIDENVETLKDELRCLVEETCDDISTLSNKNLFKELSLLLRCTIEDL